MSLDHNAADPPEVHAWNAVRGHFGIAEQGKLYALEGRHALALAYYREAIRLTVQAGEPEIVFRHYLECVLEVLERTGAYQEVLDYCAKALALLDTVPATAQTALERSHVLERQACVLLKSGQREAAATALREALAVTAPHGLRRPLVTTLLGWIERGFQIEARRVVAEQERTHYFNVRHDTVDAARAVKLPNEALLTRPASVGKGTSWQAI
jgi:tetratricopeptide (TPR) repeat protein